MSRSSIILLLASVLAAQAPAMAAKAQPSSATQLTPDQAADRQVWIDEHARWNAEHMAAARRLEKIVAALREHNTGFDIHGRELREHGAVKDGGASVTDMHPRLRTAHEQARNVHDDLMDAVDALTRVMRKNLGKNQSFPDARDAN